MTARTIANSSEARRAGPRFNSSYVLPSDSRESNRLTFQQDVLRRALANVNWPLLIPHVDWKPPANFSVLDSGTGNGAWLFEVAHYLNEQCQDLSVRESMHLQGIDITTRLFPPIDKWAHGMNFREGTVTLLAQFQTASYDLVHQRFLIAALKLDEWKAALAEMNRVLIPGGWIVIVEPLAADCIVAGEHTKTLGKLVRAFFTSIGLSAAPEIDVMRILRSQQSGFEPATITSRRQNIPIGIRGGEGIEQRQLAKDAAANFSDMFASMRAPIFLKRFRSTLEIVPSEESFDQLIANVREEWATVDKGFVPITIITAQKEQAKKDSNGDTDFRNPHSHTQSMASTLTVSPAATPFPYAALVAAAFTSTPIVFNIDASIPELATGDSKLTNELEIVQVLTKNWKSQVDDSKNSALYEATKTLSTATAFPAVVDALNGIDDRLAFRTFLVGHALSAIDIVTWGAIKGSVKILGVLKSGQHPHVSRWYAHIDSLEETQDAIASLIQARSEKARSSKTSSSFALGLPNAVDGKVITRFPPEPSGYLHIGHAKASMLNQYFAKMYHGKLIIRFDDTNPTKEKAEFEETILEDLSLIGVCGDTITHTSDYFDYLYSCAVEVLKRGKAYADDTEQAQMRHERMHGIASQRRDSSIEENLQRFEEMKKGTTEGARWCIRAKISVDDNNKSLRDPVIYRVNTTPHHRTGSKWKVYPTYDFACPVIDAHEGVTHALRTNEYRDRNPQYNWMLEALSLRKVDVWDFSRLSFIYTLLSKRKLHMFVNNNLVEGWDDPRFPTVRGIRRRGLTVEALQQYMLSQGPSQSVVSLEWDGIWATNKKIIDPIAPRYFAIASENRVKVSINGVDKTEERSTHLHKKNPDVGTKPVLYSSSIFIEQEDGASFEDGEEITLMDWGNAIVRKMDKESSGVVTAIEMDLHLEGDFKKTKKKVTWLADSTGSGHRHIPISLHDYDYLITKKKLEEDEDVKDFITPVTEFIVEAFADSHIEKLEKGDIIQFERKGFYILDAKTIKSGGKEVERMKFIHIPDGRAASTASKSQTAALATKKTPTNSLDPPVETKMYKANPIYGSDFATPVETKMYAAKSVYAS